MGLDFDRVAKVRVRQPAGPRTIGSGYLVGPRLVLTAAHTLGDQDPARAEATVELPTLERVERLAQVVWSGDREHLDAALLEIVGEDVAVERPVRWGVLAGSRPGVAVQACGYPDVEKRAEGRELAQALGIVNPGTGRLGRRYEIDVAGALPVASGSRSPWAGTSGAALFCGPFLVGVVIVDRGQTFRHGRIVAVPVAELAADAGFATAMRLHTGRPVLLEPAELGELLSAPGVRTTIPTPAYMLRADVEAVGFTGREAELAELRAWCAAGGSPVRLLVGPGGQGKTRLARRLGELLRAEGWLVGAIADAVQRSPTVDEALDVVPTTSLPLLLVVDYAETRPDLVGALVERVMAHSGRAPVRVLLIARSDEWWQKLTRDSVELEMVAARTEVQRLARLTGTVASREAAYAAALTDLDTKLSEIDGYHAEDRLDRVYARGLPDLQGEEFGQPLRLQMSALAALLGGDGPEQVLLAHERRYWRRRARLAGRGYSDGELDQAVAAATLFGAADRAEARAVIAALPATAGDVRGIDVLDSWLRALYPGDGTRYWQPLEPDLLGEHLVTSVATEAPEVVDAIVPVLSADQASRALTVLTRALDRYPEHATRLARLGSDVATRLADERSRLGDRPEALPLIHASTGLVWFVGATLFDDALPGDPVLDNPEIRHIWSTRRAVAGFGVAQARRALELTDPADMVGLAVRQFELGDKLYAAGDKVEAFAAMETAVQRWRALALGDPVHGRSLVTVLGTLGEWRQRRGDDEGALSAAVEAVEAARRFVTVRPKRLDVLISTLEGLSSRYRMVERDEEAIAVDEEVVAQRRVEGDPAALALALSKCARSYADLARLDDAVEAGREAVEYDRALAAEDPEHRWWLANDLVRLARWLHRQGRPADAVAAAEEAVAIYRDGGWSGGSASDDARDLADARYVLALALADDGRPAEALVVLQEWEDPKPIRDDADLRVNVAAVRITMLYGRLLRETGEIATAVQLLLEAGAAAKGFGLTDEAADGLRELELAYHAAPDEFARTWERVVGHPLDPDGILPR